MWSIPSVSEGIFDPDLGQDDLHRKCGDRGGVWDPVSRCHEAAAGRLRIAPTREAVYMVCWFGVGLLAIGMITWFARDEAASLAGRAIARALTLSYGAGVLLAV